MVMMPFEVLCYLLQEKHRFRPEDLFGLWDYDTLFPEPVGTRSGYWQVMTPAIARILRRPVEEVFMELEVFRLYYEEAVREARRRIEDQIRFIHSDIPLKVKHMTEDESKKMLVKLLIQTKIARLLEADRNILKNRKPFLPYEEPEKIEEQQETGFPGEAA
ncbi:hypothetical protein [Caldibacillus debilis]|uniref:hypothetical protein n=1 Tax=Caldibacillus debilis TaxID=301148 RepID=UPI003521FE07